MVDGKHGCLYRVRSFTLARLTGVALSYQVQGYGCTVEGTRTPAMYAYDRTRRIMTRSPSDSKKVALTAPSGT